MERINVQKRLESAMAESIEHYAAGAKIMRDLIDLVESANPKDDKWMMDRIKKVKQAEIWLKD